jgi:primosomal replication protein N
MNRLILAAQLVERSALRYTPAGLPVLDVLLRHESQVVQSGQQRIVGLDLRARVIGELVEKFTTLEMGSQHGFGGFLGSQRNGRGVLFHVTEIDSELGSVSTN